MSSSTDSVLNEDINSTSLLADVTDDSCMLEFIEIVPLTRDTDGPCTTECDSGDWSAQVKQENLPVVKQEPQDVCCIVFCNSSLLMFVIKNNLPYSVLCYFIKYFTNSSSATAHFE